MAPRATRMVHLGRVTETTISMAITAQEEQEQEEQRDMVPTSMQTRMGMEQTDTVLESSREEAPHGIDQAAMEVWVGPTAMRPRRPMPTETSSSVVQGNAFRSSRTASTGPLLPTMETAEPNLMVMGTRADKVTEPTKIDN